MDVQGYIEWWVGILYVFDHGARGYNKLVILQVHKVNVMVHLGLKGIQNEGLNASFFINSIKGKGIFNF